MHQVRRRRQLARRALVVLPAMLGSLLIAPGSAQAAPGTSVLSGVAVRADGTPAAGAVVTLIAEGASGAGELVGGVAADDAGHFEIQVPATESLVGLAESSGNLLSMRLSIESLVVEGSLARTFEYVGQETAALISDLTSDRRFVVVASRLAYVLRPVDGSDVDLTPTQDAWIDAADGGGVFIRGALTPAVGQANVLGIGAIPVQGPYEQPLVIAPDPTEIAADWLNGSTGEDYLDESTKSGSCDPSGQGEALVYQYTPLHTGPDPQDRSIQTDYTTVPYQRNKAHFRLDTGEWTWQIILCGFGGSKTMNGWRLLRAGMVQATYLPNSKGTNIKIGQAWDNENNDKEASASLDFTVTAGPANVSAKIPTGAGGNIKGSAGVNGPQPDDVVKISRTNSIHAWYQAVWNRFVDHCCRGSRDFEGIVNEGLYEMGEISQPSVTMIHQVFFENYCSASKPCPLYN